MLINVFQSGLCGKRRRQGAGALGLGQAGGWMCWKCRTARCWFRMISKARFIGLVFKKESEIIWGMKETMTLGYDYEKG